MRGNRQQKTAREWDQPLPFGEEVAPLGTLSVGTPGPGERAPAASPSSTTGPKDAPRPFANGEQPGPGGHHVDPANEPSDRETRHDRRRGILRVETLTAEQRVLRARLGAYHLHATHDPKETTRKVRAAFATRFEREVDPDGVLRARA